MSSGNAVISGGSANGLSTLQATTAEADNFSSGNAVISGGSLNGTPIGATSASTGRFSSVTSTGVITSAGNLVANSGVASTTTTTGALVVAGGAGISGSAHLGGSVYTGGNVNINSSSNPAITTTASTAYVFNETATSLNIGAGATSVNIGNTSGTTVISGITKASGNLVAASTTDSTGTTVGALVVAGGAGIAANVHIGKGLSVNQNQVAGGDFIAEGVNDTTLLWANPTASYDSVVIGGNGTSATLVKGAKLIINSNDSMILPVGSNSNRPGNSGGTDTVGMIRYSSTSQSIEYYNGANWINTSTTFTVITEQQFIGTGSQTDFTLSRAATTASVIVSINGVLQIGGAGYAYTVTGGGTTLSFSEAPLSTDVVDVRILITTTSVNELSSDNGYNKVDTNNSAINLYTGSASPVLVRSLLPNGAEVNSTTSVTATGATTIDTWDATLYSSAEYTVTATSAGGVRSISKIIVAAGSASGAYATLISTIDSTGGTTAPGAYSATNTSGTVNLVFTPTSGTYTMRIKPTYQAA